MQKLILSKLCDVEEEHKVKILYACESGSRIWGFASKDSDWDVRFIYRRPLRWYLTIERLYNFSSISDTIEYPVDSNNIDIAGWDISKALQLLYKSNCPLLEWLQSNIIYIANPSFTERMLAAGSASWSRQKAMYHYYHMTIGNIKDYLINKEIVWTKKYIYIIRTLLACKWIEKNQTHPPVSIFDLLTYTILPIPVRLEIEKLLDRKIRGEELGKEPHNKVLTEYVIAESDRIKNEVIPAITESEIGSSLLYVNNIFQRYVMEESSETIQSHR